MSRDLRAAGTTILLTTHYLEEAERLCDRIAIIDNGRVVACDTTAALIAKIDEKTLIVTLDRPIAGAAAGARRGRARACGARGNSFSTITRRARRSRRCWRRSANAASSCAT